MDFVLTNYAKGGSFWDSFKWTVHKSHKSGQHFIAILSNTTNNKWHNCWLSRNVSTFFVPKSSYERKIAQRILLQFSVCGKVSMAEYTWDASSEKRNLFKALQIHYGLWSLFFLLFFSLEFERQKKNMKVQFRCQLPVTFQHIYYRVTVWLELILVEAETQRSHNMFRHLFEWKGSLTNEKHLTWFENVETTNLKLRQTIRLFHLL